MISSPFISSRACGVYTREGWEELHPWGAPYNLMSMRSFQSPVRGWGCWKRTKGSWPASLHWGPLLYRPHVGPSVHRAPPPLPPPTLTAALTISATAEDHASPRRPPPPPQCQVPQAFPRGSWVQEAHTHPAGHGHQKEENFLPKADTAVTQEKGKRCQESGRGSLLVKAIWCTKAKLGLRGRYCPEDN